MMEFSRLTVLLVGELLIGLSILSGLLIAFGIIKKNRLRKAVRHLVARIESDKPVHKERLKNRLADQYQYAGEDLEKTLHGLSQAEMLLYQNMINSYQKQDTSAFQQVDVDVENLVLGYQELKLPEGGAELPAATEATETEATEEAVVEIQRLQDENERLSDELQVTMDTVARMLNEYSSMFAGGSENELDKEKIMGMFQEEQADSSKDGAEETSHDEDIQRDEESSAIGEIEIVSAIESDIGRDEVSPSGAELEGEVLLDVSTNSGEAMEDADRQIEPDDRAISSESTREVTSQEDSLMNDLEQVDIELPDSDEIAAEDDNPTQDSLEDEWAKLLEEDAESADKIEQAK